MRLLLLMICSWLLLSPSAFGQYLVKGRVNLGPDWQPKIFMAAVKKLSDYYRTSPDMIVSTATVQPDGSFTLSGDNLPPDPRFYRIYLMKVQNTDYDACLYVGGDDHNFAHVLLQNGDSLEIITDSLSIAPFGDYQIRGNRANQLMRTLAKIVFPSFYFYRIKFPTELKFSVDKLHVDLKQFADTCSNTLVALAAVNNTDFDEYFDTDKAFYERFSERLKSKLPNSIYTQNYLLKIKYYANEEETTTYFSNWLIGGLCGIILVLSYLLFRSNQRIQQLKREPSPASGGLNEYTSPKVELTPKEKEILRLISEGNSNKEIATNQYVELSTVKTHINKIYAKIGVSNRREAKAIAKEFL